MTAEQEKMLDELLANDPDQSGRSMTDWEVGFVESINGTRNLPLRPKQAATLQKIWYAVFEAR